jgi:hypothetical protein
VAKQAKMTDLYDTTYRMTCGDAVHATVNALDRHVTFDAARRDVKVLAFEPVDEGKIGRLTYRLQSRDLVHTLSVAANALLHVMEAITRVFPREEFERTVKSCMDRWQNLVSTSPKEIAHVGVPGGMDRPYLKSSISQLEALFDQAQSDVEALRALDHELGHRTTDRANSHRGRDRVSQDPIREPPSPPVQKQEKVR